MKKEKNILQSILSYSIYLERFGEKLVGNMFKIRSDEVKVKENEPNFITQYEQISKLLGSVFDESKMCWVIIICQRETNCT